MLSQLFMPILLSSQTTLNPHVLNLMQKNVYIYIYT